MVTVLALWSRAPKKVPDYGTREDVTESQRRHDDAASKFCWLQPATRPARLCSRATLFLLTPPGPARPANHELQATHCTSGRRLAWAWAERAFCMYRLTMDPPRARFVVTPWRDRKELLRLRQDLYAADTSRREAAVNKVSWLHLAGRLRYRALVAGRYCR